MQWWTQKMYDFFGNFNQPDSYNWEPETVPNPPFDTSLVRFVCSGLFHLHQYLEGSELARHPIIFMFKVQLSFIPFKEIQI